MDEIKVLIADDQRLVRDGISSLLDIQPDIHVVSTAINGKDAIHKANKLKPDVILMDVQMPELDGISAVRKIKNKQTDCQILMLTTFDDEEYIIKSLVAGASGYLLKDIPASDLAQAVRMAYAGIFQLDPSVAGKLVSKLDIKEKKNRKKPILPIVHELTEREFEVLRLIATGATNREIAQELVVSEGTVKNHVSNILNRLGLRDRIQAALYAHEHGLI
ncbi:MAG: response regulator transcription factor [Anaerolineaceae bacterium]|nr:response regulator transcription factor [Anaerolineaceae bacterium]